MEPRSVFSLAWTTCAAILLFACVSDDSERAHAPLGYAGGDGGPASGGSAGTMMDGGAGQADADGGTAGAGGAQAGGTSGAGAAGAIGCEAEWKGDVQSGSAAADESLALVIAPDDSLIVGGYRDGVVGTTNIEPAGPARGWIRAMSPSGQLLWERFVEGEGTHTIESMVQESDNTLLLAGRTSGALGGANAGQFDVFVARAALAGTALEVIGQAGAKASEHPRALTLTPAGWAIVGGYVDTYVPEGANYVERWEDELTMGLSMAGAKAELAWMRTSSFDGTDYGYSVVADPLVEGDHFVAGVILTGATKGPFVKRVRSDGVVVWQRKLTSNGLDAATALAIHPDGSLLVSGATFSSLAGPSAGQMDAFVLSLDRSTGDTIWGAQAGSSETDYVKALAVGAAGEIVIAGETLGDTTGSTPHAGEYDIFAVRLSANGGVTGRWQKGSAGDEELHAVALDRCGRAFVAGATRGSLAGQNLGSKDGYLLRVF